MARFALLLLVALAVLIGPHDCQEDDYPPGMIQFIHPTFDLARGSVNQNQSILTLIPGRVSVEYKKIKTGRPERELQVLVKYDEAAKSLGNAAAITWLRIWEKPNDLGVVTYNDERKRLDNALRLNSTIFWAGEFDCHKNHASRAFEAWRILVGDNYKYSALSLDQGIAGCLIEYKDWKDGKLFEDDVVASSTRLESIPSTRYKVASMWASRLGDIDSPLAVRLIDEAGFLYIAHYDVAKAEWARNWQIISLSSYDLEPKDSSIGFNYSSPHVLNDSRMLSQLAAVAPGALDNLRLHYEHAFVESILLFQKSLCWSKGTGPNPNVMRLNCFGPKLGIPSDATANAQSDISIRAVEMYEYNNRYYFHATFVPLSENGMIDTRLVKYQYHVADSLDDMNSRQVPESQDKQSDTNLLREMVSDMMPIDIVYLPECKRVAVFYQHLYTLHKPDEPIGPLKAKFSRFESHKVDWMNYPVNAILYNNKRLYLFSSGNLVTVGKEMSLSESSCDLNSFQAEAQYPASQLLLHYEDHLLGTNRNERLPVYNGKLFWTPKQGFNLNLTSVIPIHKSHAISSRQIIDQNTTTVTPPIPGPDPKPVPKPVSKPASSLIIVIVIVLTVIGIVVGFVYYFCCSASDELIRRPKSAIRKFKTLGGSSPPGGMAAGPPVGSTLTPHATVRSGLHLSKQGSATGSASKSATQAPVPAKSAGQVSVPAKTVEQQKSSPRSPRSPKSLRSHKSRSPGPLTGSQKTKTVGSVEPIGSKKSSSPAAGRSTSKSSKPSVLKQLAK